MKTNGTGKGALAASAKTIVALACSAAENGDITKDQAEAIHSAFRPKLPEPASLPDSIMAVREVAAATKKTTRTVFRLVKEGHLVRAKFPGRTRGCGILRSSVVHFIDRVGGIAP